VSLQGPSEAKFGSKQDYNKSFIEINLRMPSTNSVTGSQSTTTAQLKNDTLANLRQCLDMII